jgi:major vault protein
MAEERKRELPLPPGTYAYVLDSTKGIVKLFVGPTVINQTGQDRPVRYDERTHRFVECGLEESLRQNIVVPEGFYAVLTNPAKDKGSNKMIYPMEGMHTTPDLSIGLKENIPGPVNFALFPGQTCEVRRGHNLRSNEYLQIKIYNEEKAKENWGKAVIKQADATITPEPTKADSRKEAKPAPKIDTTPSITTDIPPDLTVGKHYNVLGTKVAFYIPPTGVSVVPEEKDGGKPVFVRQAETLEQLEYSILVDENGNKQYPRGPAVVFPEPTQQFLVARDSKGNVLMDDEGSPLRKFKAIEMNALQGIQLKFMNNGELTYADGTKESYKAGEEKFIKGDKMPIYYPEEGHQLVRYDGKTIHYAVAVTKGEGKYVLERETGNVKLVEGPIMLLPDPVKETIAYRALSDRESRTWFPGEDGRGSPEALAWNRKLRQEAGNAPTTRQGVVSEGQLRPGGGTAGLADLQVGADVMYAASFNNAPGDFAGAAAERGAVTRSRVVAKNSNMQESRQGKDQQAVVGDVAERRSTFNEPRAIVFASRLRGVPVIKVQPGFAVNVVNADGTRKTVVGPKTILMGFSDTLDILRLSTGKPKNTDQLFETAYLNTHNNKVTDVIDDVETSDHIVVSLKLSYNVNFEGEPSKWFTIENYVKHMCDHVRSIVKGAIRKKSIEEFYKESTPIIRDLILGAKSMNKDGTQSARTGLVFPENGMKISDVEVLKVSVVDPNIAALLSKSQHEVVKQNIELSLAEKSLDAMKKKEELARQQADAAFLTEGKKHEIQKQRIDNELSIEIARINTELKTAESRKMVEELRQAFLDLQFEADMVRQREASSFNLLNAQKQQALQLELLDKQVEAVTKQLGAIAPGLIEALNSVSARETLVAVADKMSFHQMFGAENAVEFIQKTFANTPLQGIIEGVVSKSANNGTARLSAPQ